MIHDPPEQERTIEPLLEQLAQVLGRALARRRLRTQLNVPAELDPAVSSPESATGDSVEELPS